MSVDDSMGAFEDEPPSKGMAIETWTVWIDGADKSGGASMTSVEASSEEIAIKLGAIKLDASETELRAVLKRLQGSEEENLTDIVAGPFDNLSSPVDNLSSPPAILSSPVDNLSEPVDKLSIDAGPSESAGPPKRQEMPRPAILDEADDSYDPVTNKIRELMESRIRKVRAGPAYSIVRDVPQWMTSADLKKAASRPINWAVKDLWTEKAKILLAAEQKAGKTWLVSHIAMCVASGSPVFGNDKFQVMDPGPVAIIAGEDDDGEIGRRLDRMFRAAGMVMSNYPIHFLSAHNVRLNRERDQDMMRKAVRDFNLKLVVYDPLARLMDGDENSKEIVSAVLNPASAMAKEENVSVMVVHHLGKQNSETPRNAISRVRGSSDISSWFSCGMFISGNMRLGRLTLEVVQRTSGNVPNDFPIDIVENQDESVYGLGSLRFVANLDEEKQQREGRNERMIEEAANDILDLVRRKKDAGVTLSEIAVHLGFGRALTQSAIKKLIREDCVVRYDTVDDLPDKKILVPIAAPRQAPVPDGRQDREESDQLDIFPNDE